MYHTGMKTLRKRLRQLFTTSERNEGVNFHRKVTNSQQSTTSDYSSSHSTLNRMTADEIVTRLRQANISDRHESQNNSAMECNNEGNVPVHELSDDPATFWSERCKNDPHSCIRLEQVRL